MCGEGICWRWRFRPNCVCVCHSQPFVIFYREQVHLHTRVMQPQLLLQQCERVGCALKHKNNALIASLARARNGTAEYAAWK